MSLTQVLNLWTSRVLSMLSRDKYFECGPLNVPSRGTIHISNVLFPDVFIVLWRKRHIILGMSLDMCSTCGKEPACQYRRCKRHGFDPWVWKIPWRRKWQPTQFLLPGESHGQRSLMGYSPWGRKESHTTEAM